MSELKSGEQLTYEYLRAKKKFPHVWCPGCGLGIVLGSLIRAIDKLKIDKDDIVMVSGIGCTGRLPVYVDFNTLHTTHGRALSFATGVKLAKPKLKVIAVMGDGDALAIGGNHFIHSARRNIGITAIVVNNFIYGMTGGQYSPTTPENDLASTAPYGHIERPFDTCKLAIASGAPFVARGTVYHTTGLDRLFEQALSKNLFSVVEVMSHCPTYYGRRNKKGDAVAMMQWQKENAVFFTKDSDVNRSLEGDKFYIGVLKDQVATEYCDLYQTQVIDKVKKKK
jgi:2-oxoglutarate ferredoxin oxidoreductase subunit beta